MRGTMVLVDTSIFIAHFRGKKISEFNEVLINEQIFLSRFVRLELLQGVRKSEVKDLTRVLSGLRTLEPTENVYIEAERILGKSKGLGISMGIVDLLLCAQANLERCPIYSFDLVFEALAKHHLVAIW